MVNNNRNNSPDKHILTMITIMSSHHPNYVDDNTVVQMTNLYMPDKVCIDVA